MAMAGVAPLAMVALEPFVDQLLVTPFMRRRAFGRPARAFLALMIVLVGIAVVVIAIRVVTVNAELRQQYSQVVGDLLKHKQSELSSATVRASVLAIGVLALIAAPLLCSFGYQSMTGGYQRWKLLRQQHDMRQLALAANLRIADGRSHIALLEEGDAAREEAESVESLVRARALRGLAERAAIGEVKAAITETPRSETTSSETRSETPPQVVSIDTPRPRGDRQLYEQILRWRREVLDADIRKAS
jgi:transcriptional regulator with XRE-family HTH domain